MDPRRLFGDQGESLAASFLRDKGMTILASQYGSRGGEIDLIARDGGEIVFVEVKTRRNQTFGFPEEAVTPEKVRKLLRTAHDYLSKNMLESSPWRIDVIAIEMAPDRPVNILHFPSIDMPEGSW